MDAALSLMCKLMQGREYRLNMAKTSVHLEFWIVDVGPFLFSPAYNRIVWMILVLTGVHDEQAGRLRFIVGETVRSWYLAVRSCGCFCLPSHAECRT